MNPKPHNKRHGGPYDRGSADSWYRRGFAPHYYEGASYTTPLITTLTPEQIAEYRAGYEDGEASGGHKEWD